MSILNQIRDLFINQKTFKLFDKDNNETNDIAIADIIKFDDNENKAFKLDTLTEFSVDGNILPLRLIVHCWLNKDSTAAEYLSDCQAKQLTNVSFLHRTDLINWLSGQLEKSSYVNTGSTEATQDDNTNNTSKSQTENENLQSETYSSTSVTSNNIIPSKGSVNAETLNVTNNIELLKSSDAVLAKTLENTRELLNHNTELRGSKPIDFGYLIKDAELKIVQSIKSSLRSSKGKSSSTGISKNREKKVVLQKDPIILIPSATSSIFTLTNIKQFLEDSKYVSPRDLSVNLQQDLVTVEKKLDGLSRPIRFLIVNNTRMFTKPEYWERVVAVFTTGHEWQFNNYQWSKPQDLFQHTKGYYFHFTGDTVPPNVQKWNVQKVEIDRNKRFKDVEVVRFFWYNLEKELLARGYR
ncbi:hypothetical protein TPHA_0B01970 [Tetrapisispora phaffii CBS 4417]|uniref:Cell division control protein 73 C-terminal domain-containing protein n=1 Tax=Tetrapisispora phaffii (strain ATCC 24235 / CBS 4417 / NBRC 1672 / NRRL Y-8282 / UCD 70-5) TaxID=1071381 RepID=G8BPD8_TETPH|nr:hypothetical protein TPHA_0B01970 [Tetrapisispora phaffii CBS 4417]CCE61869.1 hypothetical protein TPHA_0B01970 [Tetrapisispora phaffii CBS 4417]